MCNALFLGICALVFFSFFFLLLIKSAKNFESVEIWQLFFRKIPTCSTLHKKDLWCSWTAENGLKWQLKYCSNFLCWEKLLFGSYNSKFSHPIKFQDSLISNISSYKWFCHDDRHSIANEIEMKIFRWKFFNMLIQTKIFPKLLEEAVEHQLYIKKSEFIPKRQSHKIVKHSQTIRRQQPTNCFKVCLTILWGERLKG